MKKKVVVDILQDVGIILLVFLFTFPKINIELSPGLDTSYMWAMNSLFTNNYNELIRIIYPFGPLGFIKMPALYQTNLLIAVLVYSILKISFIISLLKVDSIVNEKRSFSSVLVIGLASYFAHIDLFIVGTCITICFIAFVRPNRILLIVCAALATIGFFIKSSIGISAAAAIFTALLVTFIKTKDTIKLLQLIGLIVTVALFIGMFVFKADFFLIFEYVWGIMHLSGGYSDTLSLHPINNWYLLIPFIILFLTLPIIIKDKYFRYAYVLMVFPWFASWKHGLSREDITHYQIIVDFIVVSGSILYISSRTNKKLVFGAMAVSILLLYGNMVRIPNYRAKKIEICGINNFVEMLTMNEFVERNSELTHKNLQSNVLTTEIRKIIGGSTIDIYPWDHTYVAANNLNWKPRKTLELGASTSQWASAKASENFTASDDSPDFVLFHLVKDKYSGTFGSIDGRYILNDEPLVIFNLLNNYSLLEKNNAFLLFKKSLSNNFSDVFQEEVKERKFGDWIDIPEFKNEIVRLKIVSHNTLLGVLKKIFYKEEAYFVDYMFESGAVVTYRYVPSTAIDGLWCNPFIAKPESNFLEKRIEKVRFRNTNALFISDIIRVQIERIKINSDSCNQPGNCEQLLFQKFEPRRDTTIFHRLVTFEKVEGAKIAEKQLTNLFSYSGKMSNIVYGKGYSYSFEFSLDTLWNKLSDDKSQIKLSSSTKYLNTKSKLFLVVDIKGTKKDSWDAQILSVNHEWEVGYKQVLFDRKLHRNGIVRVYVWNIENEPVYIDDFQVRIEGVLN